MPTLTDDHAVHLERIEQEFVEYRQHDRQDGSGTYWQRQVKYEALLHELESATQRTPSEGIRDAAWHFLQDFEPQEPYAWLFLHETFNRLWGDLATHAPGAGNSNGAERALGERGRAVLIRLLFNADFRKAGRSPATVDDEIREQVRTLWPEVKTALKRALAELRVDPDTDNPILQRLVKQYCPKLAPSEQRALMRQLQPRVGHRSRSLDEYADLVLSARVSLPARRVRAARSSRRRPA